MVDIETNGTDIDRRNVLQRIAAGGLSVGVLGSLTGRARSDGLPNTIEIIAVEAPVKYLIEVSGEIAKGKTAGGTDTLVDDNAVEGFIGDDGEKDDYRFSGKIVDFRLSGEAKVFVNGKRVTLKKVEPEPADLPHHITIESVGPIVTYRFVVTGDAAKGPSADEKGRDRIQAIDDNFEVTGLVSGDGKDDYFFSGDLVFDEPDEPVAVSVNWNADGDP